MENAWKITHVDGSVQYVRTNKELDAILATVDECEVQRTYVNWNSRVFYRGFSPVDGAPIVGIISGLVNPSGNEKTGGRFLQTWILRADVHPKDAVKLDYDKSICGTCIHRGNFGKSRTCYVRLSHGPAGVWESFDAGNIVDMSEDDYKHVASMHVGLRMGAYGDPGMIPFDAWAKLLDVVPFNTGYTHRPLTDIDARFSRYVMASCETKRELDFANSQGYRGFYVAPMGTVTIDLPSTIECRATAVNKQCDSCKLCGSKGESAGLNIWIAAHGIQAQAVARKVAEREASMQYFVTDTATGDKWTFANDYRTCRDWADAQNAACGEFMRYTVNW